MEPQDLRAALEVFGLHVLVVERYPSLRHHVRSPIPKRHVCVAAVSKACNVVELIKNGVRVRVHLHIQHVLLDNPKHVRV